MDKSIDYVQMSIRLPDEIHAVITAEAQRQRRSFNAQLLTYLDRLILNTSAENTQLDTEALKDSSLLAKVQ